MSQEEEEVLEILRRAVKEHRSHAGFFWWQDRSPEGRALSECGAVQDLFHALDSIGRADYYDVRPSGDNWPDCEATGADGGLVGIEVTELVDEKTLREGTQPEPWTSAQLLDAIQNRIDVKDRSSGGRKYSEVVLLIHTDELYLNPPTCITTLEGASFDLPHGNLDRVFLLFSYWPELECCPATELTLVR